MFEALFVIVPTCIGIIFVFTIAMIVSPKLRGKMMSNQIKASKYMIDECREDLKIISDNMAYVTKDGVKTTARAIKEGFTEENTYCKHCGSEIDEDSKFCKHCGKEQ